MKRITVLCALFDRERALERLRDLGVLHLAHVQAPASDELDRAREHLVHTTRALETLPAGEAGGAPSGRPADEVVEETWRLLHERQKTDEDLETLVRERARIEPFGSFDPASLAELKAKGLVVKLYQVGAGQELPEQEGVTVVPLESGKKAACLAAMALHDFDLGITEFRPPDVPLEQVHRRIGELEARRADQDRQRRELAADRPAVAALVHEASERVRFLEARDGMGRAEPVAYVRGYGPVENVEEVRGAAKSAGWAVLVEDPEPGEQVPSLIRNPRWIQPIKVVFDMIGILPGYDEIDISAAFLLFFSIFFAMLVGDAGYGVVFLLLTMWARRKFRRAPAQPFTLLYIMSVCTIVWGVVTGTYFGITNLPAPLAGLRIDWLGSEQHIMELCFFLGACHLTVAHLWNAARGWNSLQALAQLGWICTTWTMFFTAETMVLGAPFPSFMLWVFAVGVLAIVLFMTPVRQLKTEWFNHVMLPLSLVSNFVDVVSYLRLFAVGTASLAVASAFNDMALSSIHGLLSGLVAALILFFGHALNILLAAMGVLVHGVRLNTLEFSSHVGMQWTGQPYRPFRRETHS